MFARTRRHTIAHLSLGRQHGVILLLIVLSMLAIAGTIFLAAVGKSRSGASAESIRAQFSSAVDLKQALLGYVLSAPISASYLRPGSLPLPDSLAGGSYDGQSDTKCLSTATNGLLAANNNTALQRCLGRWPWAVIPIDMPDAARDSAGVLQANDPNGGIPWLAVSANLAFLDSCLPVLNSDVSNLAYTTFACGSTTALPHPWLTVRGSNGEAITNRAAAVIILPGKMVTREGGYAQARASAAAPGNPVDYLDRISLPIGCSASCTGTYDNAGLNNEFIQLSSTLQYPDNAEDATKRGAVPFNDIVAYITIDELVPYLERRVLAETKNALNTFAATAATPSGTLGYPWAAPDAVPPTVAPLIWQSTPNSIVGTLPFFRAAPVATPVTYTTGVNWNISALQTSPSTLRVCRQVRTGPTRWANVAQNTTADASARIGSTTATGNWRSTSEIHLPTVATSSNVSFSKTFSLSTNVTNCNNGVIAGSTNSGTYTVTRRIALPTLLNIDATQCTSSPTPTFAQGSVSMTQSFSWACNRLTAPLTQLPITITDSLASPTAVSNVSYSVYPSSTASVAFSGMRYQPVMGNWFYDNAWQTQAFYGVANSVAPSTTTNCASATKLTSGTSTNVNVIVGVTGRANGSRSATNTSAQREGTNATASTTCTFEATTKSSSAAYNDQLTIVAP